MSDSHAHGMGPLAPGMERYFVPESTMRSKARGLSAGAGGLLLGAGSYGMWMHDEQVAMAPLLLGVGAIMTAVAAFLGASPALRVGPAGIATESADGQVDRIYWFEIDEVTYENEVLSIRAGDRKRVVARAQYPGALAFIVKEATSRIPTRTKIASEAASWLSSTCDDPGKVVPFDPIQSAGRLCKASNTPISFEEDAVLCPGCGQVYHRQHLPPTCVTCERSLVSSGPESARETGRSARTR